MVCQIEHFCYRFVINWVPNVTKWLSIFSQCQPRLSNVKCSLCGVLIWKSGHSTKFEKVHVWYGIQAKDMWHHNILHLVQKVHTVVALSCLCSCGFIDVCWARTMWCISVDMFDNFAMYKYVVNDFSVSLFYCSFHSVWWEERGQKISKKISKDKSAWPLFSWTSVPTTSAVMYLYLQL